MTVASLQRRTLLAGFLACASAMLAGCGGGPGLQPVTGKVLLNKKAAEHATVVLHPVTPAAADAPKPRGTVSADGTFAITTNTAGDGAPPGEYRVTVEQWLAGPRSDDAPTNRLPAKYSNPATSGLTAVVGPGPTELKVIELTR